MKEYAYIITVLSLLGFTCGCSKSQPRKPLSEPTRPSPTDAQNEKSETQKTVAAQRKLEQLGAVFTRKPYGDRLFNSVDLRNGWKGKSVDLNLLADIDDLWELYLGPAVRRDDFRYLRKLRDIKHISVTDTSLSRDDIQVLKRHMPGVRIFDIYQTDQLIPIPSH